jgi:hypothetical protein
MIIVLGSSKGIDEDLNNIADGEYGVNYVDGNGIFIGTFYSHLDVTDIYGLLSGRPAFLLFNISDGNQHMVNLPSKYYKGLFPEIDQIVPQVDNTENSDVKIEEDLTKIDEILDKLKKNNYDTSCLTEKESKILNSY